MDLNNLDDHIRKELEKLPFDYDPGSWDQLSQRLDQEDISMESVSDEEIDPMVRNKLKEHRVTLDEEHWDEFNEILDKEEDRRRNRVFIKAAELVIFILLLFTISNYSQLRKGPKVELNHNYFTQIEKQEKDPDQIAAHMEEVPYGQESVAHTRLMNTRISAKIQLTQTDRLESLSNYDLSKDFVSSVVKQEEQSISPGADRESEWEEYYLLPSLKVAGLPFLLTGNELMPQPSLMHFESDLKEESKGLSVSIPVSYDANFINAPLSLSHISSGFRGAMDGGSVGVNVGYRKKNLELESGLIFSSKTYIPGDIINYSKSSEKSFLESRLDASIFKQLSLPLELKYYFGDGRLSLYVSAGASLNTILMTEYSVQRSIQSNVRLSSFSSVDQLDIKSLPAGLMQGGDFANNAYISLSAGIGLQASVTNGISLFFSPVYQRSTSANINELMKSINVLSLETGLKFSF